jgi:site-specific recombinase XerD
VGIYNTSCVKNFTEAKPKKLDKYKFLDTDNIEKLLKLIGEQKHKFRYRDYTLIFCGYFLGLRIGEAVLLSRRTFQDVKDGVVYIKTLKQGPKIKAVCRECGRTTRFALGKKGQEYFCVKCKKRGIIDGELTSTELLPERELPTMEQKVIEVISFYIANFMKPENVYLFESRPGVHLCKEQVRKIFSHYILLSGIDKLFSWHSLRHGRGVFVWERFENLQMVREMLRQKSLSSTEVYIHMSPQSKEKLRNSLEKNMPVIDFPR